MEWVQHLVPWLKYHLCNSKVSQNTLLPKEYQIKASIMATLRWVKGLRIATQKRYRRMHLQTWQSLILIITSMVILTICQWKLNQIEKKLIQQHCHLWFKIRGIKRSRVQWLCYPNKKIKVISSSNLVSKFGKVNRDRYQTIMVVKMIVDLNYLLLMTRAVWSRKQQS